MSDIQRYIVQDRHLTKFNGFSMPQIETKVVKYDDHIQKINEKCRRTAIVTAESWNKQVEKLQARIDELEAIVVTDRRNNFHKYGSDDMRTISQMQAEGIREMLDKLGFSGKFISRNSKVTIGDIWDYANKLKKDDKMNN